MACMYVQPSRTVDVVCARTSRNTCRNVNDQNGAVFYLPHKHSLLVRAMSVVDSMNDDSMRARADSMNDDSMRARADSMNDDSMRARADSMNDDSMRTRIAILPVT